MTSPEGEKNRTSAPGPCWLRGGRPPRAPPGRSGESGRSSQGARAGAVPQVAEGSRRERHVEPGGAQPVERGHRVGRVDGGAPAAERPGDLGVRADEGDPAQPGTVPPGAVQREQRALVAGQHEAGRGGRAQLAGNVHRRRGDRNGAVKPADPGGQPQDAEHLVVEEGLVDLPGPDRRQQGVAPRAEPFRRARHGQVQRGPGGRFGGPGGRPVRHDQAVVAPLVVQDGAQQRAFRHRRPVDPVVGGHHRPGTRLAHDGLERRQVELAQRPLVDPDVHGHPLGLRVVADEVLDGGTHPLALQAAHVGDPDPRGEQRVLGEALEVPAAVRGPVQVHRGGEQHVHALAARLGGQQPADRRYPVAVPGGGQRRRRRHVRRGVPLVPGLAADSGRAVGGHDPAQARDRVRGRVPRSPRRSAAGPSARRRAGLRGSAGPPRHGPS